MKGLIKLSVISLVVFLGFKWLSGKGSAWAQGQVEKIEKGKF